MARMLGGLRGFWAWYQDRLTCQPVRTQIMSSGILWAVGDVSAQTIERRFELKGTNKHLASAPTRSASKELAERESATVAQGFDLRRIWTTSLFGFAFVGPIGHYWYEALDTIVRSKLRLVPNSLPFLGAKVFADCLLFGPIHLLAFFTYAGLASGKPLELVKKEVKRDFLPTFMVEEPAWFIVQIANFRFLPVRHQLVFVNFFCILDSAFLSWVKHQDDSAWKRWMTSLVTFNRDKDQ